MRDPACTRGGETSHEGTSARDLVAAFAAAALLLTALYFAAVALDRWAAASFARASLAAMLVATLDVVVFAAAICLAPLISLLLRLPLGRRVGGSTARPVATRFLLAGGAAAVVLELADLVGWLATDDAASGSFAIGVPAGAAVSAAGGILCGAAIWALAYFASRPGPAAAWTARPFARVAAKPLVLGAALAGAVVVLAAAVPVRVALLHRPRICALADVAALAVAFTVFHAVTRLASRLRWRDRGSRRSTALVLLLAGAAGCSAAGFGRPYLVSAGLIDLVHMANMFSIGAGIWLLMPEAKSLRSRVLAALILACGAAVFVGAVRSEALRPSPALEVRPSRWFYVDLPARWDLDGDGYSPIFGGDCDDFDPFRNPGAIEIPENGVDDNCHGGDKLVPLPWKPRPTFVQLPPSVQRPKRVLLLIVDSLRADRVSCYGYDEKTTPNLDLLAQRGVRFAKAYSASPLTCFAFPILFTGRLIPEIKWNLEIHPAGIREENTTVAEVMRDAGFRTAAFLTYYATLKPYGTTQGFDYINSDLADPLSDVYGATTSEGIVDRAIRWIEAQGDERWFVFAHFMEPHSTYLPHEGIPNFGKGTSGLYNGEVFFADRAIGRLLARLKELGLDRDTAVVAMGDHGEMLGAHGQKSHGTSLWQEVLEVPLIVSAPGLEPRVSPCVTSNADVAPTILNLVGIDGGRHGMTTSTLVPDLVGTCDPEREIVSELRDFRSLVGPKYKLIYNVTSGNQQLYDLDADPQERRNLFAAQPALSKQMLERLMAWEEHRAGAQVAEVLRRAVVDEVPPSATRVDARFDIGIDLLAVDMGDRRLTTNDPLRVAVYLRAARRVPPSCRIRVEVKAGNKRAHIRGRGQHKPAGGALPFELFPVNRIVEDVFHLAWKGQAGRMRVALAIQCGPARSTMRSSPPGRSRAWLDLGEIEVTQIKRGARSGP